MTTDIPCPRRDKWFRGCRFEPRYEEGAAQIGNLQTVDGPDAVDLVRAFRPRNYVHDICIVCGKVVDRGGAR
jgi:hypothetical protein